MYQNIDPLETQVLSPNENMDNNLMNYYPVNAESGNNYYQNVVELLPNRRTCNDPAPKENCPEVPEVVLVHKTTYYPVWYPQILLCPEILRTIHKGGYKPKSDTLTTLSSSVTTGVETPSTDAPPVLQVDTNVAVGHSRSTDSETSTVQINAADMSAPDAVKKVIEKALINPNTENYVNVANIVKNDTNATNIVIGPYTKFILSNGTCLMNDTAAPKKLCIVNIIRNKCSKHETEDDVTPRQTPIRALLSNPQKYGVTRNIPKVVKSNNRVVVKNQAPDMPLDLAKEGDKQNAEKGNETTTSEEGNKTDNITTKESVGETTLLTTCSWVCTNITKNETQHDTNSTSESTTITSKQTDGDHDDKSHVELKEKEHKEGKELKEDKEHKEDKELKEDKEHKEDKEYKEDSTYKAHKDAKDHRPLTTEHICNLNLIISRINDNKTDSKNFTGHRGPSKPGKHFEVTLQQLQDTTESLTTNTMHITAAMKKNKPAAAFKPNTTFAVPTKIKSDHNITTGETTYNDNEDTTTSTINVNVQTEKSEIENTTSKIAEIEKHVPSPCTSPDVNRVENYNTPPQSQMAAYDADMLNNQAVQAMPINQVQNAIPNVPNLMVTPLHAVLMYPDSTPCNTYHVIPVSQPPPIYVPGIPNNNMFQALPSGNQMQPVASFPIAFQYHTQTNGQRPIGVSNQPYMICNQIPPVLSYQDAGSGVQNLSDQCTLNLVILGNEAVLTSNKTVTIPKGINSTHTITSHEVRYAKEPEHSRDEPIPLGTYSVQENITRDIKEKQDANKTVYPDYCQTITDSHPINQIRIIINDERTQGNESCADDVGLNGNSLIMTITGPTTMTADGTTKMLNDVTINPDGSIISADGVPVKGESMGTTNHSSFMAARKPSTSTTSIKTAISANSSMSTIPLNSAVPSPVLLTPTSTTSRKSDPCENTTCPETMTPTTYITSIATGTQKGSNKSTSSNNATTPITNIAITSSPNRTISSNGMTASVDVKSINGSTNNTKSTPTATTKVLSRAKYSTPKTKTTCDFAKIANDLLYEILSYDDMPPEENQEFGMFGVTAHPPLHCVSTTLATTTEPSCEVLLDSINRQQNCTHQNYTFRPVSTTTEQRVSFKSMFNRTTIFCKEHEYLFTSSCESITNVTENSTTDGFSNETTTLSGPPSSAENVTAKNFWKFLKLGTTSTPIGNDTNGTILATSGTNRNDSSTAVKSSGLNKTATSSAHGNDTISVITTPIVETTCLTVEEYRNLTKELHDLKESILGNGNASNQGSINTTNCTNITSTIRSTTNNLSTSTTTIIAPATTTTAVTTTTAYSTRNPTTSSSICNTVMILCCNNIATTENYATTNINANTTLLPHTSTTISTINYGTAAESSLHLNGTTCVTMDVTTPSTIQTNSITSMSTAVALKNAVTSQNVMTQNSLIGSTGAKQNVINQNPTNLNPTILPTTGTYKSTMSVDTQTCVQCFQVVYNGGTTCTIPVYISTVVPLKAKQSEPKKKLLSTWLERLKVKKKEETSTMTTPVNLSNYMTCSTTPSTPPDRRRNLKMLGKLFLPTVIGKGTEDYSKLKMMVTDEYGLADGIFGEYLKRHMVTNSEDILDLPDRANGMNNSDDVTLLPTIIYVPTTTQSTRHRTNGTTATNKPTNKTSIKTTTLTSTTTTTQSSSTTQTKTTPSTTTTNRIAPATNLFETLRSLYNKNNPREQEALQSFATLDTQATSRPIIIINENRLPEVPVLSSAQNVAQPAMERMQSRQQQKDFGGLLTFNNPFSPWVNYQTLKTNIPLVSSYATTTPNGGFEYVPGVWLLSNETTSPQPLLFRHI